MDIKSNQKILFLFRVKKTQILITKCLYSNRKKQHQEHIFSISFHSIAVEKKANPTKNYKKNRALNERHSPDSKWDSLNKSTYYYYYYYQKDTRRRRPQIHLDGLLHFVVRLLRRPQRWRQCVRLFSLLERVKLDRRGQRRNHEPEEHVSRGQKKIERPNRERHPSGPQLPAADPVHKRPHPQRVRTHPVPVQQCRPQQLVPLEWRRRREE